MENRARYLHQAGMELVNKNGKEELNEDKDLCLISCYLVGQAIELMLKTICEYLNNDYEKSHKLFVHAKNIEASLRKRNSQLGSNVLRYIKNESYFFDDIAFLAKYNDGSGIDYNKLGKYSSRSLELFDRTFMDVVRLYEDIREEFENGNFRNYD